jgi:hypothetical protein
MVVQVFYFNLKKQHWQTEQTEIQNVAIINHLKIASVRINI